VLFCEEGINKAGIDARVIYWHLSRVQVIIPERSRLSQTFGVADAKSRCRTCAFTCDYDDQVMMT